VKAQKSTTEGMIFSMYSSPSVPIPWKNLHMECQYRELSHDNFSSGTNRLQVYGNKNVVL